MIVRTVRMTFRIDEVETFLKIFDASKEKIRQVPGCLHLQLLEDVNEEYVLTTYSLWETEEDLNAYRHSALFGEVWPKTKRLFAIPPVAHSYHQRIKMD